MISQIEYVSGDIELGEMIMPIAVKKKNIGLSAIFKHLDGTDNDHDQSTHDARQEKDIKQMRS